jgi:hypothetical protein
MKRPGEWMSSHEWEQYMECRYDTMPSWYWNVGERQASYKNYIKDLEPEKCREGLDKCQ